MNLNDIEVLIPTFNEEKNLPITINSLKKNSNIGMCSIKMLPNDKKKFDELFNKVEKKSKKKVKNNQDKKTKNNRAKGEKDKKTKDKSKKIEKNNFIVVIYAELICILIYVSAAL